MPPVGRGFSCGEQDSKMSDTKPKTVHIGGNVPVDVCAGVWTITPRDPPFSSSTPSTNSLMPEETN